MANRYKVPKSQWRKWNDLAKHVFNEVYGTMKANPRLFHHPSVIAFKMPTKEWWNTTSWNAAWTAADAANMDGA